MYREALERNMRKQIMVRIQEATRGTTSRRKYWAKVIDLAVEREKRRPKTD